MKFEPFYLIVDSAEWVERLVPLGVKLVELRIKDRSEPVLREEKRRSKATYAAAGRQEDLVAADLMPSAVPAKRAI
ncbi:hypothetical protein [Rhizobium leguminosarum]|uniref:hypothetical protein n=1 Tax=Rhizobium leguminosarum TaxID=384 RepID=UPI0004AE7118